MMYQQGGSLYNEDVTEIAFEGDDRFAKGLEFWRSLVTDGCMIDPNSRANHGTIIVSEFYEQKVGMIYTTSSNLASFSKEAAARFMSWRRCLPQADAVLHQSGWLRVYHSGQQTSGRNRGCSRIPALDEFA